MLRDTVRVRIYDRPKGDPKCQLILQGSAKADIIEMILKALQFGLPLIGASLLVSGETRRPAA